MDFVCCCRRRGHECRGGCSLDEEDGAGAEVGALPALTCFAAPVCATADAALFPKVEGAGGTEPAGGGVGGSRTLKDTAACVRGTNGDGGGGGAESGVGTAGAVPVACAARIGAALLGVICDSMVTRRAMRASNGSPASSFEGGKGVAARCSARAGGRAGVVVVVSVQPVVAGVVAATPGRAPVAAASGRGGGTGAGAEDVEGAPELAAGQVGNDEVAARAVVLSWVGGTAGLPSLAGTRVPPAGLADADSAALSDLAGSCNLEPAGGGGAFKLMAAADWLSACRPVRKLSSSAGARGGGGRSVPRTPPGGAGAPVLPGSPALFADACASGSFSPPF